MREITLQNYLIAHINRFEIGNSLFRIAVPEIQPPLKTGDCFQVISGSIDLIDDELYYIADIRKVDIHLSE